MTKRRILFTGGGGAGSEALMRLGCVQDDFYFADARVEAMDPLIPKERCLAIPYAGACDFIPAMREACRKHEIDILVPTVDEELVPLARSAAEGGLPELFLPPVDFVALMLDKLACMQALANCGLPVPRTVPIAEASSLTGSMILKPRSGRGSRGVVRVRSAAQASAYLALNELTAEGVIAQECVTGQEYTVFVLADRQAHLRAILPVRVQEKRGVTILAHTAANQLIEEYVRRLHDVFRPTGPYNVQCIVTASGEVLPFEVNPRVSTTFCLVLAAGIDAFSLFAAEDPTTSLADYRRGIRLQRNWHNHISHSF